MCPSPFLPRRDFLDMVLYGRYYVKNTSEPLLSTAHTPMYEGYKKIYIYEVCAVSPVIASSNELLFTIRFGVEILDLFICVMLDHMLGTMHPPAQAGKNKRQ